MDEKSQNSKTDNDYLRDAIHGYVWGSDPHCTDITGSPIERNIFPSRSLGRRHLRKVRRGRPRGLPRRIKNKLTIATARRLTERMGLLMTVPESHPVDPHIPSQLAMGLIYE